MKNLGEPDVLRETQARLRTVETGDRALWGMMSVGQMVRHLGFAYEVALGDRAVAPLKGAPPWLVKFFALRVDMRWPKNLRTTPEMKQAILECQTASVLDEDVAETVALMNELAAGRRCARSHPMFGTMRSSDWMRWGYLHADHHLRQFGR